MKASEKSLKFLGEWKKLAVPFFQRSYVWDEGNWEELLASFDNTKVVPFLGPIILKNVDVSMGPEEKMIIDGQQRLTTITLLSKALYDTLPNNEDFNKAESGITSDVKSFLFYRDNSSDEFQKSHVKIAHSRVDHEAYEKVIRAGLFTDAPEIDLDQINNMSSKILRCYKYYREKLENRTVDELKKLHDAMFSEERTTLVIILLEFHDINEQCIFDTINRAGVHLSAADIIKNNLFKHLLDTSGDVKAKRDAVIDFYTQQWEKVFNPDQATMDLWDVKRRFGNVTRSNLEFLLYCVACARWEEDGDIFSELDSVYEKHTSEISYDELFHLLKEILDYARIYKKFILDLKLRLEDESVNEYFQYKDGVSRLLLILEKFSVQMFYPYVVMRLYQANQDVTNQELLDDFHVLESFIVRRKVSSKGTNDYTSKCYMIIQKGINSLIESDLANPSGQITDTDVREYLRKTEDNTAKMILFWIESSRRQSDLDYDVTHLEYKYTLEHIMPKKWEKNWKSVPIIKGDETLDPDSEEGIRFRNQAIQQLGNKTLLTGNLNSSIKNSGFSKKINGEGKKAGYKSHVSLTLTQKIVDDAQSDPNWDEKHIEERTRALSDEFLALWPSFSDRITTTVTSPSSATDVLANYSDEQLADPIKLLNAMQQTEGY